MDPVLRCDELEPRVARGDERRVPVTVCNPGPVEDHYRLEVLGEAARWSRAEPRHLPGVPGGGRVEAELVLRPRPDVPAGRSPVAVRCVSLQDPTRCAVIEGDVLVATTRDMELATRAVAAPGRSGRYVVDVRNHGAAAARVRLAAADPRQDLRFALAPRELTVPAGATRTAYLAVRPRRPRLLGSPVPHRFTVEHRTEDGAAGRMPVEFEQRPLLGGVATVAVAVLAAAAVAVAAALAWPAGRGAQPEGPAVAGPSSSAPGASGDPIEGYYVLWGSTPVDDDANRQAPDQLVNLLRSAGVAARVVDSRTSPQLASGRPSWLVVQDRLSSKPAAEALCDRYRDIVPSCEAGGPP